MRCKQGDLAWINKSLRPSNIGKVVTCSQYMGYFIEGESISEYSIAFTTDHHWRITSSTKNIEVLDGFSSVAFIPDTWLTPITPPPLMGDEDTETPYELEDNYEKMA